MQVWSPRICFTPLICQINLFLYTNIHFFFFSLGGGNLFKTEAGRIPFLKFSGFLFCGSFNLQESWKNSIRNSQVTFAQIHKLPLVAPFALSSWSLSFSLIACCFLNHLRESCRHCPFYHLKDLCVLSRTRAFFFLSTVWWSMSGPLTLIQHYYQIWGPWSNFIHHATGDFIAISQPPPFAKPGI